MISKLDDSKHLGPAFGTAVRDWSWSFVKSKGIFLKPWLQ